MTRTDQNYRADIPRSAIFQRGISHDWSGHPYPIVPSRRILILREFEIHMSQHAQTKLQRLLDAFQHARYPDGYPSGSNEDALAKRLMSEFRNWCHRQGLTGALEQAEKEASLLEAAEELEDAFARLAAEGKARSICVPRADGTIERRWSLVTKETTSSQARPKTQENN
jgi:hypothetical protein